MRIPGRATPALGIILILLTSACTTDATRRAYLRTIAESYGTPPRPAIVIPGFGVTRLFDPVTHRFVWGTGRTTMQTHYTDDLDLPVSDDGEIGHDRLVPRGYVGSRGPVNTGWQLMEGLRKFGRYRPGRDVFPFEYDWRLRAEENAARLDELFEGIRRDRGAEKVDIVTHSAGAIVALAYVKLGNGGSKVDHLVLVAPTRRGVVDAFRVLVRPEHFLRRVFAASMVATWPFVTELLPENGRFLVDDHGRTIDSDLWSPEGWRGILQLDARTSRAFFRELAEARAFRQRLESRPLPGGVHVSVIAGDCVATARRVLLRKDGTFAFYPDELRSDERPLRDHLFEPGDGTVPIRSASAGAAPLIVCDGHQGIAADPTVHRAILRTLREPSR